MEQQAYWQELMSNFELECESLDFLSNLPSPSLPLLSPPDDHQMDFDGGDANEGYPADENLGVVKFTAPSHYHKQQSMPTTKKEVDGSFAMHQTQGGMHVGPGTNAIRKQQQMPQRINSEPALLASPYEFPDVFEGAALSVDDIRSYPDRPENHGVMPTIGGDNMRHAMMMAGANGLALQHQQQLGTTQRRNFTMEKSYASTTNYRQRRPQKLTWVQKQELYMRKHGMLTNYNGNTSLGNLTDINGINITDLDSPVFVSSDKIITPAQQKAAATGGTAAAKKGGGASKAVGASRAKGKSASAAKAPGNATVSDGFTGFVKSGVLASVALTDCDDKTGLPTVNTIVNTKSKRAQSTKKAQGKPAALQGKNDAALPSSQGLHARPVVGDVQCDMETENVRTCSVRTFSI